MSAILQHRPSAPAPQLGRTRQREDRRAPVHNPEIWYLTPYIYWHPARRPAVTFMLYRMNVDIMAIHAYLGSTIVDVTMVKLEDASLKSP